MIVDLLEALTIFCFGLSWPISIRKSLVSRTAKGKSLFFDHHDAETTRLFMSWR